MSYNFLDHFLLGQLGAWLFIFCRIGSALMVLPGYGEVYVAPRIRLMLALVFSVMLVPLLEARMPPLPGSPLALFILMLGEIIVGVFMGLIARTILMVLHVSGSVIASQSSLAVAALFDPSTGAQSAVVSNLLTLTALLLFFTLDLHHLVLAALVHSYDVFAPGSMPSVQDMNILHLRLVGDCFALGVALAGPHIIFSLLFYLAGGLMTRLMPNFQVFFIMMSPQILIAFFLLMALCSTILGYFANFMQDQYMNFIPAGP